MTAFMTYKEECETLREQLSVAASEILALRKANKECVEYFNEAQKDLAEKDAEIGRLTKLLSSYKTLTAAQENKLCALNGRLYALRGADKTLDSEREANALLTDQLAASQLREQQLREALKAAAGKFHNYAEYHSMKERTRDNIEKIERNMALARMCDEALDTPTDTSALEAMIKKAGEVMRERCAGLIETVWDEAGAAYEIRALPGVTMEDLKG